jgi:hypothetical protein
MISLLVLVVNCIRFDLPATTEGNTLCLSQLVWGDTPVSGTADTTNVPFQTIDFTITEGESVLFSKKALSETTKFSFTTQSDVPVKFCFKATLTSGNIILNILGI